MKIGILGGSFDPIHNGHLHMAVKAYEEYELDEVWLIPAGHSPNKDEGKMTKAKDRLAMCRLAAAFYPFLKVSDIEMISEERSYTYRTIQKLTESYPDDEWYFIMGADSLDYFDQWRHPEIIGSLAHILVVNRDEFQDEDLKKKIASIRQLFSADIQIVHCEKYPISSREIRTKLMKEEEVSGWISQEVLCYIKEHDLYRS